MSMKLLAEVIALDDPTEGSLSELAARLRVIRDHKKPLGDLEAALELEILARMDEDTMEIPYVGRARKAKRTSSAWRDAHSSEALRHDISTAVVRAVSTDRISGDINPLYRNVAEATMDLALDVIPAFSSIKAAGRRLGLDLDDYRTTSEIDTVYIEQSPTQP